MNERSVGDPRPEEPPEYLAGHIREALALDPRTGELNIEAEVVSREIFLKGKVATEERRQAVGEVVRERFPKYEVHNRVVVDDLSGKPEVESF
jgi:osmotically-inducible protein OsmY